MLLLALYMCVENRVCITVCVCVYLLSVQQSQCVAGCYNILYAFKVSLSMTFVTVVLL